MPPGLLAMRAVGPGAGPDDNQSSAAFRLTSSDRDSDAIGLLLEMSERSCQDYVEGLSPWVAALAVGSGPTCLISAPQTAPQPLLPCSPPVLIRHTLYAHLPQTESAWPETDGRAPPSTPPPRSSTIPATIASVSSICSAASCPRTRAKPGRRLHCGRGRPPEGSTRPAQPCPISDPSLLNTLLCYSWRDEPIGQRARRDHPGLSRCSRGDRAALHLDTSTRRHIDRLARATR